jgi:hypothetical protein
MSSVEDEADVGSLGMRSGEEELRSRLITREWVFKVFNFAGLQNFQSAIHAHTG